MPRKRKPPPVLNTGGGRPLEIAYLTPDFRNHAAAHLTRRLYAAHDREKFEIFGYSIGPDDGSVYRREIEAGCDTFHDCRSWPVSRIVEQNRESGCLVCIGGGIRDPSETSRWDAPVW